MQISRIITSLLAWFAISCLIYAASPMALAAISISSIEYPASPETVTMGESVPIIVNIKYDHLAESGLGVDCSIWAEDWIECGHVTLSGSGTYQFPPVAIKVPPNTPTGRWNHYINEWNLTAHILSQEKHEASKSFTLLVENPEKKPKMGISTIEYIAPPNTVDVNDHAQVKISVFYENIDFGTKMTVALRDRSGTLISVVTGENLPLYYGSGVFDTNMSVRVKEAGEWVYWPQYINEWPLTAELLIDDQIADSEGFTLLVENPEKKPKVKIRNIEYVVPPDTIAVNEPSRVMINVVYSNLDPQTKVMATIRDHSELLDSGESPPLSGSGEYTFTMTIAPRRAGSWDLVAYLDGVSDSLHVADKEPFQIRVVPG